MLASLFSLVILNLFVGPCMCVYSWFASGRSLIKKATFVISDFGSVSLLIIGSFSSSCISKFFVDCQTSCVEQLKPKYLVFMPGKAHACCHRVESVQSEVELGFGFVVAMVTTSFKFLYFTLCVGWGLGCLEGFSQCSRFMLCFLPCQYRQLCLRGGGLSLYSCSFPSIDCCCLLVLASLEMGAGGILCFPNQTLS